MMQKLLAVFAPRSRADVIAKFLQFCGLIVVWHVVWSWYISGQTERSLMMLVVDALVVGGPFAAIFTIGSWYQVKSIRELYVRARVDPLSGVLNRQTFIRRLRKAVAASHSGMLLLIDADFFKRVNDRYGHATGDLCIEAIGHRLSWHLRENDLVGRIGGEEFAVFLPDVTREHGRVVATRLGQPVSFTEAGRDQIHTITLSIGAIWTTAESSADAQLMMADDCLYKAKTSGRARMIIRGEDMPILLGRVREGQDRPGDADTRRVTSRPQVA